MEAVQCAVTIQRTLAARNAALPPHRQMVFRMGLHVGDIVVDQERVYGAAVNLAARLERMAEGGGLCISAQCMTTSWPISPWTIVCWAPG